MTFEDLNKIRVLILEGKPVSNEVLREAIALARQTRMAAGTPKPKTSNGEKQKPISLADIGSAF